MNTSTINIPASISRQDLITRAGSNIPPTRVVFDGKVFDGTFEYAQDEIASIDAFRDAVTSAFEITERVEHFPGYTPDEIAIALEEVLARLDGGVSQICQISPDELPGTRRVSIGYNLKTGVEGHRTVPTSPVSIPGCRRLNKKHPAWIKAGSRGGVPWVQANVIRDDQGKLDGIFGFVRDWADKNTIYAGQCVDLDFNFINRTNVKPQNVALTERNTKAIDLFVRQPFKNPDRLAAFGQSPKTGVLFYGPPGGGKTMTATLAEYIGVASGGVVIHVDPSLGVSGLQAADTMSLRLLNAGHAVMIVFEDVEKLAREDRAKVLEILDGGNAKQHRRIVIGTTNFLEQIDRAMIRPGRFDSVLYCGLPDKQAFTQLINVLIPADHRGVITMDEQGHYGVAFPAFEGYSYAMIANAVSIIIRSAIAHSDDDTSINVGDDDLITAAELVRDHHDLLNQDVEIETLTIEDLMRQAHSDQFDQIDSAVREHGGDHTDYGEVEDRARSAADSVVEGRLHNASIVNGDGDPLGSIETN